MQPPDIQHSLNSYLTCIQSPTPFKPLISHKIYGNFPLLFGSFRTKLTIYQAHREERCLGSAMQPFPLVEHAPNTSLASRPVVDRVWSPNYRSPFDEKERRIRLCNILFSRSSCCYFYNKRKSDKVELSNKQTKENTNYDTNEVRCIPFFFYHSS